MSRLSFDMLKFQVESAPYEVIAHVMKNLGASDTSAKVLMRKAHNLIIPPMANPLVYFVVTEEMLAQIRQDVENTKFKDDAQRGAFILVAKIGTTPCMGLTQETVREEFKSRIAQHNSA